MPRLILFDIDFTLIRTHGAGRQAMDAAFLDLFGVDGATTGMRFDGRTDCGIFAEALRAHGLDDSPTGDPYRAATKRYLERLPVSVGAGRGEVLPGVSSLLDGLAESHAAVGLATGNFRRGAEVKLGHFGLWDRFAAGGFGDGKLIRAELVAEGIEALAGAIGIPPDPADTLVIGDTPLDIEAGHLAGARAMGVATGRFTVEQLLAAGAEHAIPDFTDTAAALRTLRA